MAKYIIKDDTEDFEAGAGLILLGLVVLFALAPGVLFASIARECMELTISQCWGCAVVTSIVIGLLLHFCTETGFSIKKFAIISLIVGLFILIVTLFDNDNCFFETLKYMFGMIEEESTTSIY